MKTPGELWAERTQNQTTAFINATYLSDPSEVLAALGVAAGAFIKSTLDPAAAREHMLRFLDGIVDGTLLNPPT